MESATPQPPPFYERRSFQGAVAVVGLLTAVWALVGAPKPWSVAHDLTVTKLPLSNTEIVLDTSKAMTKSFGDGTKLDAAKDAIAKYAAASNSSGLALRQTGGGCYDDGDVLVDFGSGHGDDVRDVTAAVRPSGVSNVINTVRGAVDDFTSEQFRNPSSTRRVVVFMGGEDSCVEAAGSEITDALAGLGVDTTFRMYTLGLSDGEMKSMNRFKAEVAAYAKVEVLPVESKKELEHAVGQEAEELDAGEIPEAATIAAPKLEEDEGSPGGPQAQGVDPPGFEGTTETTPETELPTEPDTDGEETTEGKSEEEPLEEAPSTESPSPPLGSLLRLSPRVVVWRGERRIRPAVDQLPAQLLQALPEGAGERAEQERDRAELADRR
jgi:hypothetical protein